MKKSNTALIIIALVLVVALLVYIILNSGYNWGESYKPDDENPYGTTVLTDIFEKTGEFEIVTDTIYKTIPEDASGNYVFVGRTLYTDSLELDFIMRFVERGGNAYISSKYHNYTLLDTLFKLPEGSLDYYFQQGSEPLQYSNFINSVRDTIVNGKLMGSDSLFEWKHVYDNEMVWHNWNYFDHQILSEDTTQKVVMLGDIQTPLYGEFYSNYLSRDYGEGTFYFHTTPEVFTNYYLLEKKNFEYAREVFSSMKDGPVYFDEHNQNYQYTGSKDSTNRGAADNEGPLTFIMSQPPLRWAWYLLLLGGLLYLILGSKRKQRVIPVLEPNTNTSIEFAETVSQLYMRQKDHRKISSTKMKLFLAFIRERYGIKTKTETKKEQEKLIDRISNLSEVDREVVKKIFDQDKEILTAYEVSNKMLVDFHHLIEHFYHNCK
ncbi:DUF4350 domain-containing protein [Halocola ammonii]